MKFLLSIVSVLLLAGGCKTAEKSVSKTQEQEKTTMVQQELSGTYAVLEIDKKRDFKQKLTITFDEASNKVSGFCGCNTLFGNYSQKNDEISFSNIFSSKKNCGKNIGLIEQSFLSALRNSNRIEFRDHNVSFYKDDVMILKTEKLIASRPSKADVIGDHYNTTKIIYKSSSREAFEYVLIAKSGITVSNDRNLKIKKSYYCNPEDWQALIAMVEEIDVDDLDKLEAPTDNRLHDGAAHATFSVIKGDAKVMTPSFDHGTPPKEIEQLVNKVLSIKENTTKQ